MIAHEQAHDLIAALALDAVDPDERIELEDHVHGCEICRPELDGFQETLSALVPAGPAPAPVWRSIAASVERPPAPVIPLRPARRAGPRAVAVAVAAAMVAVVAAAAFGAGRWTSPPGGSLQAAAAAARAGIGATVASLTTPDGASLATVVLMPDGTGYVTDLALPALPADRTYQLWEVTQGGVISAGVLGNAPKVSSFQAVADVSALVITDEVAGGVPSSAGRVVAAWEA